MLLEWVPADSAVHRVQTDGQAFGWTERMLWQLIRRVEENSVLTARAAGNKKYRIPREHPKFPWISADDDAPTRFGSRGDHDSEDVMAFLDNL